MALSIWAGVEQGALMSRASAGVPEHRLAFEGA
jgi:hypothetical protein